MKSCIEISLLALTFSTSKYSDGRLRNNKEKAHTSALFYVCTDQVERSGIKNKL